MRARAMVNPADETTTAEPPGDRAPASGLHRRRERHRRSGWASHASSGAHGVELVPPPRPTPVPYIVLVGLDLSEPGGRAWRFAFDLADLRGEAEIHAVVVGSHGSAPPVRDVATPDATSTAPLRVLQHRSAHGKARLMAMHFRTGRPDHAIVDLARELQADLIVVASQPTTTLQRLLGGSVADRIARNAPCPVVVVKPKRGADDPGWVEFPK